MSFPRRHLPSMACLTALEAVSRLGTASAAAAELALTQGAVSRALRALEEQLGTPLLTRERQRLRLTPAGEDYVRQIRPSLAAIAQASVRLRANPGGGSLSLAILPAFGMHCLAPKLADFARLHPGVTINLSTRLRPFDFGSDAFDAAIHFGREDWPGAHHLHLMEEVVLPVCSPSLLSKPLSVLTDMLDLPLLKLESRPGAWGRYFASHGTEGVRPGGMVFDHFATMKQGAVHGLGVALLPLYLIDEDLKEGRLVPAWRAAGRGLGSYYLVWPKDVPERPALAAFKEWIAVQFEGGREPNAQANRAVTQE